MRSTLASRAVGLTAVIGLVAGSAGYAGETRESEAVVEVHATTIARKLLERHLTVYGEIVPEPASPGRPAAAASISSATGGMVVAVDAVEGQTIDAGQIVVRLDSRQADAAVERARAALAPALTEAQRQQRLAEHDDSSARQREIAERQLGEARAALVEAETARDYVELRTPLHGTVLRVDVRPGEVVEAGAVLVEIVDLERMIAEIRIPAAALSSVRDGMTAVVQASGRDVDGRVVYVGARVDPATGTAAARIEFVSAHELHPGDFVRARIVVESRPDALAAPSSAVVYGEEGTGTVAVLDDGRAHLHAVRLGIEDGDWVEIEGDGIGAGVRIVAREAYGLPDDTPVRVVEESVGP